MISTAAGAVLVFAWQISRALVSVMVGSAGMAGGRASDTMGLPHPPVHGTNMQERQHGGDDEGNGQPAKA